MNKTTLPARLTLTVALSIFVIEVLIMSLLPAFHLDSPLVAMFLDSTVLVLTLVPVLYVFILRPMTVEVAARETAELRLREVNAGLEARVVERTRELEVALKAAEAAAVAKSQFLACMSHELRTPLNAVIGMTQLLLDTPLSVQQAEFARMSNMGGETLLALINDILDFSKLEAGKMELDFADFDLLRAVEDCAKLVAAKAHERGLEIAVSVPPDVPRALHGDDGRLRQVLMNLLNNAVKFTSAGEVVLSARRAQDTEKTVTVRFEVRDTGIGISPEARSRLFQAFTQADGSTTRRYGGTGLGLAISRWIVELMGGRIGVESDSGLGSTFWFEVPFELSEASAADRIISADLAQLRILVVDDNATNREILKHRLDAWGMSCRAETDGTRGLTELHRAAAAGQAYGLALIDMQMPGMDGLGLARAVRADAVLGRLPLVLMTSMDRAGLSQDALGAGVEVCLTKPVRQSALFDAIVTAASRNAPVPRQAAPAAAVTRAERVLIAEDIRVNQMVVGLMLKKLGFGSDAVGNGIEALKALSARPYALILMDSYMPEMDGFATTAAIRKMGGRFQDIPIVALTANAMPGDREKCLEAGMNDYLSKPVSIQALELVLSRWLHPGGV